MPLGDRMKRYESCTRMVLPLRTNTVLRVDGRAFHTYTRKLDKPYDSGFVAAMDATALALAKEVDGARIVYVQSDEISVVFSDLASISTQPWFDGVVQKQVSVASAAATASFLAARFKAGDMRPAMFDARVFTIPDPAEVNNYLVWRQQDCVRNSIQGLARAHFSAAQLRGLNNNQVQELLFTAKGINWATCDPGFKNGRMVVRKEAGWDLSPSEIFTRSDIVSRVLSNP